MGKPARGGGKKKNAGVGVDFKRIKHKVGKKLPRAQNQTDTSFKSRTISLAEQSVAADKGGQAVTGRNLTLKDLLGQCSHYSERVRKDALQGLIELLGSHPEELRRHTTLVMEAAAERITDADKGVRASARELLGGTLLPALGGSALAPFVPLVMAHICAAMTHLADPIRADALAFLDLLMTARPDLVAAGFLAPVLQHFSDLLSKGSRGRSIKAGSLASLHGVVLALQRFLSATVTALGGGGSGAGGRASGAEGQASSEPAEQQAQQAAVLMWRRCQWPPAGASSAPSGSVAAMAAEGSSGGRAGAAAAAAAGGTGARQEEFAGTAAAAALLGHLLDCWSEAGPSQLAESPDLVAAQCLTAILRSCDLLLGHWGAELAGSVEDRTSLATALLKKVPPFFPMQRPAVQVAAPLAEQLVLLNVAAAQLLARFLPSQATVAFGGGDASGSSSRGQPWAERLLDWFAAVMAEGSALPAADDGLFGGASAAPPPAGSGKRQRGGGSSGDTALPAAVFQSVLDGSLQVLPLLPLPRRQQLLGAAWQLWQRSSARSGTRGRVLAFWQALLQDPAAAFYAPVPGGGPLLQHAEAATWLAALPRFLFEIGSSNPAASRAALELLMGAARCAPAGSPLAAALQGLQPQLAPLFALLLPPTGGKQQQAGGGGGAARMHVGPLAGLPPAVQELAVDLLFHFPAISEQLLRMAALVCLGDSFPTSTALRLLEVLAVKAAAGAADAAAFCGLLLNLLSGASLAGPRQRSWARHEALVGAACQAALGLGRPAEVGALLLPPLLDAAAAAAPAAVAAAGDADGSNSSGGSSSSSWAAYGLLQLAATAAAAAAAGQQDWRLPEPLAAALPQIMLQLQAGCQQQEQGDQQQQKPEQQPAGGSAERLGSQKAAALCVRLLALHPRPLLPLLLAAMPGSLQAQQAEDSGMLPAALALMLAMLREVRLREALLEEQAGVQAALAACGGAVEAAGGATLSTRGSQGQLRQLEALCAAVLG